ncbi:MAG: CPBP family intramembrane metalloprotease [Actinomycetota bacterium]|nr:CPBP family intramembrane metalloprotease [Actinomycetota bacterium]
MPSRLNAREEPTRGRAIAWLVLIAVIAAVSFAGRVAGGRPPKDAVYRWDTALGELLTFAVIFVVVLAIAAGLSKREAFALRPPVSWGLAAKIMLGVLITVLVLSQALDPLLHPGREQGLAPSGWDNSRALQFAANLMVLGIAGPVVEELTFRGLGFHVLRRYGRWTAIVGTGVAFGVWHGLIYALPVLTAFGIGLAYLRDRTESIYPTIALHVVFNSLALIYSVSV